MRIEQAPSSGTTNPFFSITATPVCSS
jgi:hypothetical protein